MTKLNVAQNTFYGLSEGQQTVAMIEKVNKVICEGKDVEKYPPVSKVRMSASKLIALGWKPYYDLEKMFNRLIQWYK